MSIIIINIIIIIVSNNNKNNVAQRFVTSHSRESIEYQLA